MSAPLLYLTSAIYLGCAIDLWINAKIAMGIVMLCYCAANIALAIATK